MTPEMFIEEELARHCFQPDEWGSRPGLEEIFPVTVGDEQFAVASDGRHLIAVRQSKREHPQHENADKVAEWLTANSLEERTMALRDLRLWCTQEPLSGPRKAGAAFGYVFNRRLVAKAVEPGDHNTEVVVSLIKDAGAQDKRMLRFVAADGTWASFVMQMTSDVRTFGPSLDEVSK